MREFRAGKLQEFAEIRNFKIYPIPDLYNDVKWVTHILINLPKFDILYSGNEWTIRCFKKHKIKAEKIKLVMGINSTKIREMMIDRKEWQKLVPKEVAGHIKKIRGEERINRICSSGSK